jgi:phosphohistidine phosphatase
MKTLYLLRHAKSSWATPDLADHDRPLNERGRKAAKAMGRHIRELSLQPDLILASTAKRVSETLELVQRQLADNVTVIQDRELYLATPDGLLSRLSMMSGNADTILIIAHNPGIHEFALKLAGEVTDEAAYDARRRLKEAYPTAALAVIRFPEAHVWSEIRFGHGSLVSFTTPRNLKS